MKHKLLYLVMLLTSLGMFAQDGGLDTAFNPTGGANGEVYASVVQSDGKLIIGGQFTTVGGITKNYLARINADGSLDTSFTTPFSVGGGIVRSIALDATGNIYIAGSFRAGTTPTIRDNIARLTPSGAIDPAFNATVPGDVYAIAVNSAGIYVVGGFGSVNGDGSQKNLTRLTTAGVVDATFNGGLAIPQRPTYPVYTLAIQPTDGKILISCVFEGYAGYNPGALVRVNTDGTLDTTFNPGTAPGTVGTGFTGATITAIAVDANGKIIVGDTKTYNGTPTFKRFVRLNSNGSLDTAFNDNLSGLVDANFSEGSLHSIAIQPNGKILIGGDFANYANNANLDGLARLNDDGTVDTTFNGFTGISGPTNRFGNYTYIVRTIATYNGSGTANKKIYIGGGDFTSCNGTARNNIARLNAPNLPSESFDISSKFNMYPNPAKNIVNIEVQDLDNASVEVYDINGRQLFTQKLNTTTNAINIENLASGMYMFKVSSTQGTATSKVVKQ
jgi:uncharacterized delta-60 repeat protein